MKLNAVAATLAAAGFVSAIPLRVVVVSSNIKEINPHIPHNFRLGRPVAMIKEGSFPQAGPGRAMKRPCAGRMGKFKEKALEISNAFRHALGLPTIETNPHNLHQSGELHGGMVKILPFIGTPPTFIEVKGPIGENGWNGYTKGGDRVIVKTSGAFASPPPAHRQHGPHHHPHVHHHGFAVRPSFVQRLHYSLMNLGPWEGRAVAFVLGCGIGVLLRMIWVLSIIMVRAVKGKRDDDHHYTSVAIIEEVQESIPSPPPNYVYPVDEKVTLEENTKAAPAAAPN